MSDKQARVGTGRYAPRALGIVSGVMLLAAVPVVSWPARSCESAHQDLWLVCYCCSCWCSWQVERNGFVLLRGASLTYRL
jgi:hypothetical protein